MKERIEMCLSGSGGQGLILAGIILAEAAGIYDGKEAVQTQSYGPEARGGASRSEVIISNDSIDYPKVINADILLALTQSACDKYVKNLSKDGILVADSTLIKEVPTILNKIYLFPIAETAQKKFRTKLVTNIISLGIIVGLTGVVSREAIQKAVGSKVPVKVKEVNKKALLLGLDIAKGLKAKRRESK
ncbi:2-oxoacid:ferredoxin oxidoreductase subunit gamma [Candidatus Atribacteria bacterium 1244-E10-H5-B2]|nr:MAG: 2-oxoacid:ferredoxin oxidoreductase subunit gamma [Candidatus Atribacteria bacterium 1244-E10-H5-B2]